MWFEVAANWDTDKLSTNGQCLAQVAEFVQVQGVVCGNDFEQVAFKLSALKAVVTPAVVFPRRFNGGRVLPCAVAAFRADNLALVGVAAFTRGSENIMRVGSVNLSNQVVAFVFAH